MKTPLSLGLMFAALCALPACSSDEGTGVRPGGAGTGGSTSGGTGGAPVGSAGTGGTATNGGSGGTGGTGSASTYRSGPSLVITPTDAGANVVDEDGTSGISGGVILAQSSTLDVAATVSHAPGKLCMSGTTATVLNSDYDTYWGAEMALDLLLAPADGAAPAADAGADAGAVALVRQPWPIPTGLVGFSFVVTGNGAAGAGVPPGLEDFRFKALPEGSDPALDTFCSQPQPTSGETVEIPLTDITWQCWAMGNPSIAEPQLNVVTTAGAAPTTRANPNRLLSISWQVAANITAPTPFDFCVSDIKPLYAQ